ncbi:MAG: M6 family metalloprotease domain-containing protein [Thermoleophilia bacterium]|nr:M6 family metalloprotease domain-containing protein [Thermoleophilia bacterium]
MRYVQRQPRAAGHPIKRVISSAAILSFLAAAFAGLVWCAPARAAFTALGSGPPGPLTLEASVFQDTSGEKPALPIGTLYTIPLLVDFSDYAHQRPASDFDNFIFGQTVGPASVRGYYRDVSYGLLDVAPLDLPSSVGWLRMPEPRTYYLGDGAGYGTYPHDSEKMIEEAIALADPVVDFSRYDCNGDGFVDNLMIVFAGHEPNQFIAGFQPQKSILANTVTVDGVKARSYMIVPERVIYGGPAERLIGVFVHEMGHVLGLQDLYGNISTAGVGNWSLMAGGGMLRRGSAPARLDPWSSAKLGWLQPQTLTGPPTLRTIPTAGSSRTAAFKLYPGGVTSGPEYFLIENRQKSGIDGWLPGSGLLVWHVDESRPNNMDETHKLVDVEEAAGIQTMDLGWNEPGSDFGRADDPYPGDTGNREFSDTTTPDAKTYAGTDSGVHIYQISDSGPVMTALIGFRTPFRPPQQRTFVDVPAGDPYHVAIAGMAADGIIAGYETAGGTEFRPSSPVLRAQFAKMIDLTLGLTVTEGGTALPFVDVECPVDDLYPDDYVAVAYANALIKGYPGSLFKPYQDVSRAQLLTMVVRAVEGVRPEGLHTPPSSWTGKLPGGDPTHGENIKKAEYSGFLWGIDLAHFDIWGKATRGEVAQVLWNTMEILGND